MKHPVPWHHWPQWVHTGIQIMMISTVLLMACGPRWLFPFVATVGGLLLVWMGSVMLCEHPGKTRKDT